MDKKKEIEEMARALHSALVYDGGYGWDDEQEVDCVETARNLINAGYGNVKQAVKEFAEKLKSLFCTECDYGGGDIKQLIDELVKDFMN